MATDCKDCVMGETCPDRAQILKDTDPKDEPGCCFGDWTERFSCRLPKCQVSETCYLVTEGGDKELLILEEEKAIVYTHILMCYSCFSVYETTSTEQFLYVRCKCRSGVNQTAMRSKGIPGDGSLLVKEEDHEL